MESAKLEVSLSPTTNILAITIDHPCAHSLHSILSFSEKSIYYSCIVYDAAGEPAVPEPCTIQANGTTTTDKTVTQNLVYKPAPLLVGSTFTKGEFLSSFTGLVSVTFGIVPKVAQATTVIQFDSHNYTAVVTA